MSAAVLALIESFEALSEAERHEAVVEILRRSLPSGTEALPDDELVIAAEALFVELDAREAADAHSQPR